MKALQLFLSSQCHFIPTFTSLDKKLFTFDTEYIFFVLISGEKGNTENHRCLKGQER